MQMDQPESEGVRLLSFDGGDIRAISQLMVLDEFMGRVERDRNSPNRILPCDYFNMMAGVGTGGIIVILLVVLRMRIKETIEEFASIWKTIFANDALEPAARSAMLEDALKAILKRRNIPETRKLWDGIEEGRDCKIFLCATPESSPGTCEKFRNYASKETPLNPTIIEAVQATCAFSTLFTPISIESSGYQPRYVTGAYSFNNPTWEMIREACEHFSGSHAVACILSLGYDQQKLQTVEIKASPSDLIEAVTSNCELVDWDLNQRTAKSNVYHRFRVELAAQWRARVSLDCMKDIVVDTTLHLERKQVSQKLDDCVEVAERLGRVTLKDILSMGLSEQKPASSHGLPSLSAFFVERPALMKRMAECVFRIGPAVQRRLVISGLGGIGKTQITISFLLRYLPRFRHILFIDGSSKQSIESGLIGKVNSLGDTYSSTEVAKTLHVLANPDHVVTQYWVIVYDNVDDRNIDIARYFPKCSFGTIIITTRNPNLRNLAPKAHIKLDIMTEEEAVNVILQSAIDPCREPTKDEEEQAHIIAQELGCLPVALVQAGNFINVHKCMHDYHWRLKKMRAKILNRPAENQLDDHYHGVYATLNVTWPYLSPPTQSFLKLLGFVNYTGLPLVLIYRAAARGFFFEPFNFCDQAEQFEESVQLLCHIFRPGQEWDRQEVEDLECELKQRVDELVAKLEKYSLITRMETFMVTTLRLHPLVHSWINDELVKENRALFQAAAVRLLVCGTGDDDEDIFEFVYPHVAFLSNRMDTLHLNDRAGLATIFAHQGDTVQSMTLWENIRREVVGLYGENHYLVTVVNLQLAEVYWNCGDEAKKSMASRMESDAMKNRVALKGFNHQVTIKAFAQMARGIARERRPKPIIMAALFSLLNIMGKDVNNDAKDVLQTKEVWASAVRMFSRNRSIDAWTEILEERVKGEVQGRHATLKLEGLDHQATLRATKALTAAYEDDGSEASDDSDWSLGGSAESLPETSAIHLWSSLVKARTKERGAQHPDTLRVIEGLAEAYSYHRMGELSIEQWKKSIVTREEAQGPTHEDTLHARGKLAKANARFEQYDKAEEQWKAVESLGKGKYRAVRYPREELDLSSNVAIRAMKGLAMLYEQLQRYEDSEKEWKDMMTWMQEMESTGNPKVVYAMEELAKSNTRRQNYDEAETLWKEIVSSRSRNALQGPTHKDTLQAINELGRAHARCKQYDEAEARWKEVIASSREQHGSYARRRVDAMEALAMMFNERRQYDNSIFWWKRAIDMRKEEQDVFHKQMPYAVEPLEQLFTTLAGHEMKNSEGVGLLKDFINKKNRRLLAPGNRALLAAQHSLAKVYAECGMHEEEEAILAKAKGKVQDGIVNANGIDNRIAGLLEHARLVLAKMLGVDSRTSQDLESARSVIEQALSTGDNGASDLQNVEDEMAESANRASLQESLRQMFPDAEVEVIDLILEDVGGDFELAVDELLKMLNLEDL